MACGLLDAVVDHNVKVWDIAAAYALCEGSGAKIHFRGTVPFPLRKFSQNLPRIQFYAGNSLAFSKLNDLLGWKN